MTVVLLCITRRLGSEVTDHDDLATAFHAAEKCSCTGCFGAHQIVWWEPKASRFRVMTVGEADHVALLAQAEAADRAASNARRRDEYHQTEGQGDHERTTGT